MSLSKVDQLREIKSAVLPSFLKCDFGDLRGEVDRLVDAGASILHLDVMDGHFVPNLSYGMPIVAGLRRHTELPLDVHLMISDPVAYAKPMVEAGADLLTFHVEAVEDPVETAGRIRDLGVAVGAAINPDTPMERLLPCLASVDLALVMSVNAGFGGQTFNPVALERLRQIRQEYPSLILEVDGGINLETIASTAEAGCDWFVVGSAIFDEPDYGVAIGDLNERIKNATDGGSHS